MRTLNRRRFLQLSGALAAGVGLAACGGGSNSTSGRDSTTGTLTWWDHQAQLQPAKEKIFQQFEKDNGGMKVEYTFANPEKLGEQLQVAKQGNQLPDVHSNAGLEIPAPQLIDQGWMAPLELSDEAMKNLDGVLIDGLHRFDGEVYAFPIFDYHSYSSVNWFNRKYVEQAGLDPENPPTSYEEFRKAAKAVQEKSGKPGFVWNIGMPIRTEEQVNFLAQAAGFEGVGGRLFATGEIAYDSGPYLTAIEFLLSLKKDGLLAPGSESWVDSDARNRWAAGAGGYYFDGPWCPGVVLLQDNPEFADSLGVGPILTPEAGTPVMTYRHPQPGEYWLTPKSKNADAANQVLSDYFTTSEYSVEVANTMSQPPRDLDAVDKSDAHAEYKKLVGWLKEQVFLAPMPVVQNVEVAKAQVEEKQIKPGLGDIIQGAFTGDVSDVKGALKKLTDDSNADWENSVKAAKGKGAKVELDDYAFANWKPGMDYTQEMYA